MKNKHWAGLRHLVEMCHRHPAAIEIDRVQPPGKKRCFGIRQACLSLFQPGQHGIETLNALPSVSVRVPAVLKPDICVVPDPTFHGMGMSLDKAGCQDMAGKIVIQVIGAPAGHVIEAAGCQNTAITHGDMGRART